MGGGADACLWSTAFLFATRALASGGGFDRCDLKRVQRAVVIADRHILAGPESMARESVAGFVVVLCGLVIIEDPARMLATAGLVHEFAYFLLVAPEAAHPAMITVLVPQLRIDVPLRIEWGYELVAMPRRTLGKLFRAREDQADTLERVRQLRHGNLQAEGAQDEPRPANTLILRKWIVAS